MARSPRKNQPRPYQTAVAAFAGWERPGCWRARVVVSALLTSLALAVTGCAKPAGYPAPANPEQPIPDEPPMTLTPQEAALYIGHPGASFIDARPKKHYRKGHAPGAVSAEWTEFRDETATLMTGKLDADLDRLAALFAGKGVARDSWAIVFGDPLSGWGEEGRIAWTLHYLGATKVSIVDGGWSAWVEAGLPVQKGDVLREPAEFAAEVADQYIARKRDVRLFSADQENWSTVLVDVREPEEFRGAPGAPSYGSLRVGHVPGAVNLPWRSLLDDKGRILPPDQLEPILINKGVRPDARIITYCTGGVRSAHTWFVLHSLGYPVVKNYSASWWEWSLDRKLGAETGGQRPMPVGPAWPPEPRGKAVDADSGEPEVKMTTEELKAMLDADDDDSAEEVIPLTPAQKLKARLDGPKPKPAEAGDEPPE